ncbi:hypothetical protein KIN20_025327, partial [Parelaphostrongylus tenuis]
MGDRLMRSIEDSVMASGVIVADGVIVSDDVITEKITAKHFVDSLIDRIAEWSKFESTLEVSAKIHIFVQFSLPIRERELAEDRLRQRCRLFFGEIEAALLHVVK